MSPSETIAREAKDASPQMQCVIPIDALQSVQLTLSQAGFFASSAPADYYSCVSLPSHLVERKSTQIFVGSHHDNRYSVLLVTRLS